MKANVDIELCIGCGLCEENCPEVFKLDDNGISQVIGDCEENIDCCQEATDNCPTEAITIENKLPKCL